MPKLQIDKSLLKYRLAQTEDEKVDFANLALKHRLYVSGWCLSKELVNLRISDNSLEYEICMAFYGDIPVGIILFCKLSYTWLEQNHFMFFVKDSFRRNGIGTNLYKLMKNKKEYFIAKPTQPGKYFFNKLGLKISN